MPRDISGNYTLPSGINPVVSGTLIDIDWANPTLDDVALQLNGVVTRDGLLGPSAAIKFTAGTVGAPGITFSSDTDTGIYSSVANTIDFSVGGTRRLSISTQVLTTLGTVTVPAYSFIGDTNTGIYAPAADTIGFAVAGAQVLKLDAAGLTFTPVALSASGSAAFPAYTFTADGTSGTYLVSAGTLAFSTGGVKRADVSNTGFAATVQFKSIDGTSGAPGYAFTSDTDTGIYSVAANELGLATSGNLYFGIKSDGRIYGRALHNVGTITGTTDQFIASGTFTPTVTLSTNADASVANAAQYLRVGNVVTVSGSGTIDPTASGTNTIWRLSLPIASDFSTSGQCNGVASISDTTRSPGAIVGVAGTDDAQINYLSSGTASVNYQYHYTYVIV